MKKMFLFFLFVSDLVQMHVDLIYSEGECRRPKPKLIPIQIDPAKKYFPHCTILHRCSDDTGCCSTDQRTCTAHTEEEVDLYFYVSFVHFLVQNLFVYFVDENSERVKR